jgi:hypothetical protein
MQFTPLRFAASNLGGVESLQNATLVNLCTTISNSLNQRGTFSASAIFRDFASRSTSRETTSISKRGGNPAKAERMKPALPFSDEHLGTCLAFNLTEKTVAFGATKLQFELSIDQSASSDSFLHRAGQRLGFGQLQRREDSHPFVGCDRDAEFTLFRCFEIYVDLPGPDKLALPL